MHKLIGILALSLTATVAYAHTPSTSQDNGDGRSQHNSQLQSWDNYLDQMSGHLNPYWQRADAWLDQALDESDNHSDDGSGPVAAPEFDPADAIAALTLLAGGLAVLRGRRAASSEPEIEVGQSGSP